MSAIQKRALHIMNVKESDLTRLKIKDIDQLIEERCTQQMENILADSNHPITLSHQKRTIGASRNTFPFVIPRCNTAKRQNSFVPKYKRLLEARSSNSTPRTTTAAVQTHEQTIKAKTACPTCGKSFIRLKTHQRVHQKDTYRQPDSQYNDMPDFNINDKHVTIRKAR